MIDLQIPGVRAGHWTEERARTGCTVVLLPEGTVGSGEVRGGAPATREFELLHPTRMVERLDAVVLTGGSAFGLAAADGVAEFCEAEGMGLPTAGGRVPIVVAMSLFDLANGEASVRPGPSQGRRAAVAASAGPLPLGRVGAGAGATVGKWRGRQHARPGGLGGAVVRRGEVVVAALVAVNAAGDIDDGSVPAEVAAGTFEQWPPPGEQPLGGTSTTIGVVLTNAGLTKTECHLVAQSGHDGFARALFPAHSRFDGDALVAAAVGGAHATVETVRVLATVAVEAAVRSVR